MRFALFFVLILLTFGGPALANQFDDALAAHRRGDFLSALRIYFTLATEGLALAQYNLAV